jgi:hypothetical protein
MQDNEGSAARGPWNKGKLVGAQRTLEWLNKYLR